MKRSVLLMLLIFVVTTLTTAASSEPLADIPLGRVKMRNPLKLDGKSRAEIAAIAAKIKKKRTAGVIKVRGDFPAAEGAEEYLTKSVFMAREVETYLKSLLAANFQVFVTASGYSGSKLAGENSVEILLYPQQLRLEEMESLRFVSTQANPLPESVQPEAVEESAEIIETAAPPESVASGLLSPPLEEGDLRDNASKRELENRISEDATRANELVNKVKARAAEKAKRDAAGD